MKRFLAAYDFNGPLAEGPSMHFLSFVARDLDDAFKQWEQLAAAKHDTTVEEMEAGFEGEPCLQFMIDCNMRVWEMTADGRWEEVDSRAP